MFDLKLPDVVQMIERRWPRAGKPIATGLLLLAVIAIAVGLVRYIYAPNATGPIAQTAPLPKIGNDNTLIGVPVPPSMGSGNTFVGPADRNGNTIYNKGGTAIGKNACAGDTDIAIGAGAQTGKCLQPSRPPAPKPP
jgi:hypothetical protein